MVSVIMPARNAEGTIVESILSVRGQQYRHWELIVVDDKSTDHTAKIVRYFSDLDSRIRYAQSSGPSGPGTARMLGVSIAEGEFVAFLDADDLWLPQKLRDGLRFMQQEGFDWIHTSTRTLSKSGDVGAKIPSRDVLTEKILLGANPICLSSAMVRKAILPKFFRHSFTLAQDLELWLYLSRNGYQSKLLDSVGTFYRLTPTSLSSNKVGAARNRLQISQRLGHGVVTKTFSFISYAFWGSIKELLKQFPCRKCKQEQSHVEQIKIQAQDLLSRLSANS